MQINNVYEVSWYSGKASNLHSGGTQFDFWSAHRFSSLKFFIDFLSGSRRILGSVLKYVTAVSFKILTYSPLMIIFPHR
jgi:hypothetical protein